MVLQNIIFPKQDVCTETELYYHASHTGVVSLQEGILIPKGTTLNFLTYFNSFSIAKWQEYTEILRFHLLLAIQGKCEVTLFHSSLREKADGGYMTEEEELCRFSVYTTQTENHCFSFPSRKESGCYYFSVRAIEETRILSGNYDTETPPKNDIHIAIGICTYRREAFVKKTLHTLQDAFLDKKTSPLYGHLQIFVSDNGKTLSPDTFHSDAIHVFHNKNAGGSGGFGRCMLEAMRTGENFHFTHMLLMDDDIILEPESLYRTFSLLSYQKDQYKDYLLGGGLLRLNRPYIQHANGETWNAGKIGYTKRNYDLRTVQDVMRNEIALPIEYCGWWYCCIPVDTEIQHFYPLPLFIHADDIEYGLRFHGQIITLNGIAVWHDAFDNRRTSPMEYYDMRNAFICNAIHYPTYTKAQAKKTICRHLLGQLLKFRYRDQLLTLRALDDFCRGTDFLKMTDPIALHQEILQMGYQQTDIAPLLEEYQTKIPDIMPPADAELYTEQPFTWKEKLTLNGWFLPAKKGCLPIPFGKHPNKWYRRKTVLLFDPDTGKGFVTTKQWKQPLITVFRCLKACRTIDKKFISAAEDFRRHAGELTTEKFWRDYLEQ